MAMKIEHISIKQPIPKYVPGISNTRLHALLVGSASEPSVGELDILKTESTDLERQRITWAGMFQRSRG